MSCFLTNDFSSSSSSTTFYIQTSDQSELDATWEPSPVWLIISSESGSLNSGGKKATGGQNHQDFLKRNCEFTMNALLIVCVLFRWSTLLSPVVWTSVTHFSMAFQILLLDDCSLFRTLLLRSFSLQRKSVTMFHLCYISFTGCQLNNVSYTKLLLSPSKSCKIGNLSTWLIWLLHNVLHATYAPTLRTCLFLFAQI